MHGVLKDLVQVPGHNLDVCEVCSKSEFVIFLHELALLPGNSCCGIETTVYATFLQILTGTFVKTMNEFSESVEHGSLLSWYFLFPALKNIPVAAFVPKSLAHHS